MSVHWQARFLRAPLLVFVALLLIASRVQARDLTFEERVRAQEAIERVYYSHQLGVTTPFQSAVPHALLEQKVRRYLEEAVALEQIWKTKIRTEYLRKEVERIQGGTRMPDRWRELTAALGNDPLLIQECLARPVLIDKLTRGFFTYDRVIHHEARKAAEEVREQLVARGSVPPTPDLEVYDLTLRRRTPDDADAANTPSARDADPEGSNRGGTRPEAALRCSEHVERARIAASVSRRKFAVTVPPDEFDTRRRNAPARPGDVGEVVESQDAFTVQVLVAEQDDRFRVDVYVVPKTSWETWWDRERPRLLQLVPISASENARTHDVSRPGPRLDGTASAEGNLARPEMPDASTALEASSSFAACGPDDSWNNASLDDVPAPRWGHPAVWTGSVMIVWGGNLTASQTGGRYDPVTDSWTPISRIGAPTGRVGHTLVWTGSVAIVWGGTSNVFEATGGRYDPISDTWSPTSTVNAPQARSEHTAVWTGQDMIVWGGSYLSGQILVGLGSGARYDPIANVWTSVDMTGAPDARFRHVAVWTGSQMIVWGGVHFSGDQYQRSGGRYDPSTNTWTPTSLTNAPPLASGQTPSRAVWTGAEMIVQRGPTCGRYNPSTDTWSPVSTLNAPTQFDLQSAVWTGTEMIVWGGADTRVTNRGYRYDPVTNVWRQTSTANAPNARMGHSAVWTGTLMIVWGGRMSDFTSTGGRYDPVSDSWTPTSLGGPGGRDGHTSVWTGNEILVWGGRDDSFYSSFPAYPSQGQRYDPALDSWSPMSAAHAPTGRTGHTAVWTGSVMIVWGGRGLTYVDNGRYDPIADLWTSISSIGEPSTRSNHTAVWTGQEMIVWGGTNGAELGTGGRYDPATNLWEPTSGIGAPLPRQLHTAVWSGSRMIVWGGLGQAQPGGTPTDLNTGGRYDPFSDTWSPVQSANAPPARRLHSAVWTGKRMLVWAGAVGNGFSGSGGEYDPALDTWTSMASAFGLPARYGHSAIWTGAAMVVWGGRTTNSTFSETNTGGRYDPSSHSWAFTSISGSPIGRSEHTAVWTGSDMMLWGGYAMGLVPGGGRYCAIPLCTVVTSYRDADGDGYGLTSDRVASCEVPPGYVSTPGDCDDRHSSAHPGAQETCDGLDNDCNGTVDDGSTPPAGTPALNIVKSGTVASLAWASWNGAAGYDVVKGDLLSLFYSHGDYLIATQSCLASRSTTTSTDDPAVPAGGDGFWYLVRARYCGGAGTYDSGGSHQSGSRDIEIHASRLDCP